MYRKKLLKKLGPVLPKDSIVLFMGQALCEEAYSYDRENYLYLMDNFIISFAVGVALAVSESTKVYLIFEDKALLEDAGAVFQALLSSCPNLFLIFIHDEEGFFKKVSHIQGIFFNIGIQSFSLNSYLNTPDSLKNLKNFLKATKGPKAYLLSAKGNKRAKVLPIDKDLIFFRDRFNFFVNKPVGATTNGI